MFPSDLGKNAECSIHALLEILKVHRVYGSMTTTYRCYYGVTWSEKGSEWARMWTRISEVVHSVAEAYTWYKIYFATIILSRGRRRWKENGVYCAREEENVRNLHGGQCWEVINDTNLLNWNRKGGLKNVTVSTLMYLLCIAYIFVLYVKLHICCICTTTRMTN